MKLVCLLQFAACVRLSIGLDQNNVSRNDTIIDWSKLQDRLSVNASIHQINSNSMYKTECETLGTDAYAISAAGNGICMHAHDCAYQYCHPDSKRDNFDLPSLTIDVRIENDVAEVLKFVSENNLLVNSSLESVSVKTTGHSYQGSSTAKDSLLIWMHHFEKDGNITANYQSKYWVGVNSMC